MTWRAVTLPFLVGGLLLVGVCWFLLLDDWWLNSDGSAYLSIGLNVVNGDGYRLPDGTALSWWDRPAYPLALTAPWLVEQSLTASLWVSRLALVVAGPLVGAAALRLTGSLPAAAVAGLAVLLQPWTLLAGGSHFVPDGLATTAVLATVLATLVATSPVAPPATPPATPQRLRRRWLVAAGVALLLALLTKETGALALPIAAIAGWVALARPRRWLVQLAVAALVPATVAALVVAAGPTSTPLAELPAAAVERLSVEVFADSPLALVAAALLLALVGWAVPRAGEPLPAAGLALLAAGTGLVLYAAGTGLGMRNGAFLPGGAALLLGALVAELPRWRPRWAPGVALTGAALLVVSLATASVVRAESRGASSDWRTAQTDSVSRWLEENAAGERIGCTLIYCSYVWLASDGDLDLELLPQYAARLDGAESVGELTWTERVGFRGRSTERPPCTGRPLVVTVSDERFGTVLECPFLEYVRTERPGYLLVSSWGPATTFAAAALIPYLEVHPAFRRVHLPPLGEDDSRQALAVYEVLDPDPAPLPSAPSYYSPRALEALPEDAGNAGVVELGTGCLDRTIQRIEADPSIGSTWAELPRCARPRR